MMNDKGEQTNRIPPHSKLAEESVLGSIMLNSELYFDIAERSQKRTSIIGIFR